jgi:amino acid adenylation domain-containing protein
MSQSSVLWHAIRSNLRRQRQAPPIQCVSRDRALPLSFAQQRLWFLHQLDPDNSAYNMPSIYRLVGSLNLTVLEQSLNAIVSRHEVLRTTFEAVNEKPVQIILPSLRLSLPVVDLKELPEIERETAAKREAIGAIRQPFDLAQGPLLRSFVIRLREEEHWLVLVMHHTVGDLWSVDIFFQELGTLYEAFSIGNSSPLHRVSVQYADYAVWQREWLQDQVFEEDLSYWKQRLEGDLAVLELPLDRSRPPMRTFHGAWQYFLLPSHLVEALKELSKQEEVTPFVTLLAAFKTLLFRYTEQTDILVGSVISNRNRKEIRNLIGFFVNTLVMRTNLGGNPSFRELVRRVRETVLGAYTHQDLPFEVLVEELKPVRDLSRSPLFQVMFTFKEASGKTLSFGPGGLTASPVVYEFGTPQPGTSMFDLTVSVYWRQQPPEILFEYNTDLFDATTISRMMGHFQTLLEGIVADPDQRISDLPLLTKAERHRLLVEWNDTKVVYPQDRCIHKLFEARVEQTPDAVAIVFEDQQLTYSELNRRVNQLAHHLRGLGVGSEALVGICAERSLEIVVGLLGTLKAGGAYVPLDPAYPRERLAFMLKDTQARVLLTQQRLAERLPKHGAQIVCLDIDWKAIAQESEENPISWVTADNLAYVIHTSGSTGRPKGVMNIHVAICNRLLWMQETYELDETDRVLQKTPFSFDVSVWEFFWPLMTGACLVVACPEGHKDPAYLVETIVEQGITTMHFVPSMLRAFLVERGLEECASLKLVICSGEALSFDLQELFFARMRAELHNLYGPTEAAIDVTFWPCERKSDPRIVPIGHPIANIQIYLLDAHLQPVPIGVPGELHIGGMGLARGYLNRPDLTAGRFIPNPFSGVPGARLYKTGDLACYLPDGNIEFLGRIDHQVKVRGFRIELGEIEMVLAQHPAVREAVVLAQAGEPDDPASPLRLGKRLVAHLVLNDGQKPAVGELRRFTQEKLPDYMVPSIFVTLEALPLTSNGKVDRRALPVPDQEACESRDAFVAPRTLVEEQLVDIWAKVLGLKHIGVYDDFFDLGGHSLLAVQVMTRVREAFQTGLLLRDLFESPTVAGLAEHIEAVKWAVQNSQVLVTTAESGREEGEL